MESPRFFAATEWSPDGAARARFGNSEHTLSGPRVRVLAAARSAYTSPGLVGLDRVFTACVARLCRVCAVYGVHARMRAYSSLIAFENGSKKRVDVVVLVVVTIVLAAGPGHEADVAGADVARGGEGHEAGWRRGDRLSLPGGRLCVLCQSRPCEKCELTRVKGIWL